MFLTAAPQKPAALSPDVASLPSAGSSLLLRPHGHPGRAQVESFIGTIYARRFDAQVRSFAPMLVGLDERQVLVAAAGYRPSVSERLYLEHYLDEPIEAVLSRRTGTSIDRDQIVEVGHLAASRGGEGLRLIRLLAAHLAREGFEWVACTVTQELRPVLGRLDAQPLTLGPAQPRKLGHEARVWGSYYEHEPVVVAVALKAALRRYARRRRAAGEKP